VRLAWRIERVVLLDATNSKAVGGYAANGFALSPIRAVFSDSIGRAVETGSEAVRLSSPPHLAADGDAHPTNKQ